MVCAGPAQVRVRWTHWATHLQSLSQFRYSRQDHCTEEARVLGYWCEGERGCRRSKHVVSRVQVHSIPE